MNIVLDLETTIKCPVGDHKANPMWLGNKIVAAGYTNADGGEVHVEYNEQTGEPIEGRVLSVLGKGNKIIGHNVKFDLLYLYRNNNAQLPLVWDTQLAEYILTGQQTLYASLDELTEKYVSKDAKKDTEIKEYWEAGVDTFDIPKDKLLKYLKGDVENTRKIYLAQRELASELSLLPLITSQMSALRATIEMARNGMAVDWRYVGEMREHFSTEIDKLVQRAAVKAPGLDLASPKQLSLYFFGGEQKKKIKEHVGEYKNGNPKYKTVEVKEAVAGKYPPIGEVGASGYYSTDDKVLAEITTKHLDELADVILKYREYSKINETYYGGLLKLRFPDGRIYPNLNHCSTTTGRLSGTNPNLQNQTTVGGVKKSFVSRFGDDGVLLELDYNQLEIVALAYLSNDKQLIEDINAGRDIHSELYNGMYGRFPTKEERKPFKSFTFLVVYGGGAGTLMAQTGCSKVVAKKFIDTFYSRYEGVKQYHNWIINEANKGQRVSYKEDSPGPQYTFNFVSPTGRLYVFKKYPNKYRNGELSFSIPDLKNWPVQGFATGDIVPMMVGKLLYTLERYRATDKAKLIMTVHDSVLLDVHKDVLYNVAFVATEALESAPALLKEMFDIDFPCSLKVGVESGRSWGEMSELDIYNERGFHGK